MLVAGMVEVVDMTKVDMMITVAGMVEDIIKN
jgi:hypothetical protein